MRATLLIVGLFITSLLSAQNNSTIGFQLHGFLPTGELKRESSEIWGGGFGVEGAFQINESPVYLGGVFDFTRYGSKVRKGFHSSALPDVRYRHHNEMSRLLSLVRIKPETLSRLMPYADFNFGFSYVYTRARIFDREFDEVVDEFFELDDFLFTYGFGGGLEYIISESVSLDLHFRKTYSNRGSYLTPNAIHYDPDIENYQLDIQQSRFNSITFGFGVKLLIREM
ncbi:MAG: opacity protein-like surface antigen [Nonlabens sp.]|jgi:opacity protein-like surface antigen